MPNDVFISYDPQDESFATQLKTHLTNAGITTADAGTADVGTEWTTAVAEGIETCKAFIVVLSPASVKSKSVRRQLDLASRYEKSIVPLVWQPTDIPVAVEYQLAGLQWLDFGGTASDTHLNELVSALRKIIGGASIKEAITDVSTAKTDLVPAIIEETPAKKGRLGKLKKKRTLSPIAVGGKVISGVVTTLNLEADNQDWVSNELKWLFLASDHLVKVHRGEASSNTPVGIAIPAEAETGDDANNKLLPTITEFDTEMWAGTAESAFNRIKTYLGNLDILLKQEAQKGSAGQGDVYLQNQIKSSRLEIAKVLKELAQLMNQAYAIHITSPGELVNLLDD